MTKRRHEAGVQSSAIPIQEATLLVKSAAMDGRFLILLCAQG